MSGHQVAARQTDTSQSQHSHAKTQMMKSTLAEINSAMKRSEKPEKSFICYEDLKSIWSDPSRISTLLQPDQLSQDQVHYIQGHMIMILSTLVSVGAADCLAAFRARLFDGDSGDPLVTDDDIPFEMDQLTFLDSESALPQLFHSHQYQFKPVVIEITRDQKTQVIRDPMLRLPFLYTIKNVGEGSYGKVDLVGISPRYIKGEAGSIWETVYEVACKKIKVLKVFDQEVENLQILKESLTVHNRIMLHLTTIVHGPNHYILLPYAKYGDLELFLHCGIGPDGEMRYDFDERFKNVRTSDVTLPLLRQCWFLANALKWLHTGITIEQSSSTIFCAHMDLKPANILIQHDPESAVGRWMISDFGISVLKEETKPQASKVVSIGDYYSQLTMNTRPKRQEGTYQAPEVKLTEDVSRQMSSLTADQRGIGRKSDIWSYGCIFSEVLAFALGKEKLIYEFQSARKGREGKDYFYVEKEDQEYLGVPESMPKQYQVHPSVLAWLGRLSNHTANSQRWVDCYVETIKKILIVDTLKRPDATRLEMLVDHVKEHVAASQGNGQVDCSLLEAKDGTSVPNNEEKGSDESEDKELHHSIFSETSKGSSETGSSASTTYVKPANAHGIMIDSAIRRIPNKSICKDLPRLESSNFKATSIALTYSSTGIHAAYLTRSSVYIYEMNVEETSASLEREVQLPRPLGWQGIAVAENFLAAWGFDSSERMLHLCDIRESQRQTSLPPPYDIKMLLRVAVSKKGAAALISAQQILVVKIEYALRTVTGTFIDSSSDQTVSPPLVAQPTQTFTDASFNDTGDFLYAWAYGRKDSLYVWRVKDCAVIVKPEFESHYKTEKKGKPYETRVIPYNEYQGCIIAAQEKRFFPAQTRSPSGRETSEPQSRNDEVKIFDAKAVCVFCDHSMITVEKKRHGSQLKEYKIKYKGNRPFLNTPVEVCKLETGRDESSRLLVVERGENIIAVVCNINATVEFIKIVPARGMISR